MDRQYPMALYPQGMCSDAQAADIDDTGHHRCSRIVASAEEEAAANEEGFYAIGEAPADERSEFETLKAQAIERGIDVKGNWGVKKLREVLAA